MLNLIGIRILCLIDVIVSWLHPAFAATLLGWPAASAAAVGAAAVLPLA